MYNTTIGREFKCDVTEAFYAILSAFPNSNSESF